MKFNWVAQNYSSSIELYINEPVAIPRAQYWDSDGECKLIENRSDILVPDWEKRLINLKTHNYKIIDGLLVSESKRGGSRPGSGRKKIDAELKRKNVTVSLSNDAIFILDKHANRSKFIEDLILESY